MDPTWEFRPTFHAVYTEHKSRDGQPFEVLRAITEACEGYDSESLPMFEILFNEGIVIDAWPEEVLAGTWEGTTFTPNTDWDRDAAGKVAPRRRPWAVIDNEGAVEGRLPVLGRFDTEDDAARWIDAQDPAKVLRGGFGLDGPAEDA